MFRKIIHLIIILQLISSQIGVVYANPGMVSDFLYDIALQYYQQGNLGDALHEAQKALIAEPEHQAAYALVGQIKRIKLMQEQEIPSLTLEKEEQKVAIKVKPIEREAENIIAQQDWEKEEQSQLMLREWELFQKECAALEALPKEEVVFPEIWEKMEEPAIIRKIAGPIVVETEKQTIKARQPIAKEQAIAIDMRGKEKRKEKVASALDKIEEKNKTQDEAFKEAAIKLELSGLGNKPIKIGKIIPTTPVQLSEVEQKPVVIAMEKVLPSPKVTEQDWIMKPEEIVTSKELQNYHPLKDAKLFINAKEVEITPIIIKDSIIRLPLEKIAKALGLVVFSPERETLTVINREGLPLEFKVGKKEVLLNKQKFASLEEPIFKYEGWTMISLQDLGKVLELETKRDDTRIIMNGKTSESKEFITFTNAKPKQVKEPEEVKTVVPEPLPALGRLTPIPTDLWPDVRLRVNNNLNSAYNNLREKSLESEEVTISGDIYDYKLYSNFKWKESETGHFLNDGKYFGLFGKNHWMEFLNLSETIPHLRTQTENYEGAQFTGFYKPFTTKIYIGERDVTVNGPAEIGAVRYYGHILGVEQKYSTDTLEIIQSVIGTEASAETQIKSGTTAFPRKNIISVTDATLKLPYRLDLGGQFGLSNYYPDNDKDTSVRDYDWRLQLRQDAQRFYWDLRYEFVGDKYASLGDPSIYQDYKGWDLYTRYKLTPKLSLSGSYSASEDNVDNVVSEPTNKNRNLSLGANLALAGNTNLGFSWLKGRTEIEDPLSGNTSSDTYDYLFSLSRSWTDLMFLLTYDFYEIESATGYYSDSGSISLYKFLPRLRGSYLRARQQIRKTWYRSPATADTTDFNTDLGLRYYFSRNLSVYAGLGLNNIRTEGQDNIDTISLSNGIQWDINTGLGFGFDFSFAPYDLSNKENRNSRAWSALFRLFNRFEINSPAKWSKIKGRIFKDLNYNSKYNYGEEVFAAVTVRIPNEFIAQTNSSGQYVMGQLTPGAKKVIIEMKDLPIELIPPEGGELNVVLEPGKTINVNFPLIEASSIAGRVFLDANNNGAYDPGEDGLEGLSIYLSPKKQRMESDENGYFFFEYLAPGIYEVTLDKSQLPIEYKLASKEKIELKLAQKKTCSAANFRIIPKPVVTKQF